MPKKNDMMDGFGFDDGLGFGSPSEGDLTPVTPPDDYTPINVPDVLRKTERRAIKFIEGLVTMYVDEAILEELPYVKTMLKLRTKSFDNLYKSVLFSEHVVNSMMHRIDVTTGGSMTEFKELMDLMKDSMMFVSLFNQELSTLPSYVKKIHDEVLDELTASGRLDDDEPDEDEYQDADIIEESTPNNKKQVSRGGNIYGNADEIIKELEESEDDNDIISEVHERNEIIANTPAPAMPIEYSENRIIPDSNEFSGATEENRKKLRAKQIKKLREIEASKMRKHIENVNNGNIDDIELPT